MLTASVRKNGALKLGAFGIWEPVRVDEGSHCGGKSVSIISLGSVEILQVDRCILLHKFRQLDGVVLIADDYHWSLDVLHQIVSDEALVVIHFTYTIRFQSWRVEDKIIGS